MALDAAQKDLHATCALEHVPCGVQSWRSIREALGNRPGSGNHLMSDDGEEGHVRFSPFPLSYRDLPPYILCAQHAHVNSACIHLDYRAHIQRFEMYSKSCPASTSDPLQL